MADKKRGLGKGYNDIFLDNGVENFTSDAAQLKLNINEIEPNRLQPRKRFDDDALEELAESIAQHGVLQPLLVRPMADGGYQIVAGERRWRAARRAGLSEVPVVVRELTDSETAELALVENLQREDLNPVEEAEGYRVLTDDYGYTQEEAAKLIGRSRSAIANSLRLLSLSPEILAFLEDGTLSPGHARALLQIDDNALRLEKAQLIISEGLSVRDAEKAARSTVKKPPTGKRTPKRSPYYDEIELALGEALGRRVRVTRSPKKGTLEIEFFDDDDLKKLLKIFDNDNN